MGAYLPVETAQNRLLERAGEPGGRERLPIFDALGRVLCTAATAYADQPPFDRSPLDGYAAHHGSLAGATKASPAVLRVCRTIYAGDPPGEPLGPGEAVELMTGAPIPRGATCVTRQEDVVREGACVRIFFPLREYENYCFAGEDVKAGAVLIEAGTRLTAAHIGILAGQGAETVEVYARPRVCVISTGSELTPPGQPLAPGKIYDSNRPTLAARAAELGAAVVPGRRLDDTPDGIASALCAALDESDFVVTTGGVSVGAHDYMPAAGELLGAETLFHGIAAKPGSPALALCKDGKLILCLSGNPFAAYATFELLAAPVIRALGGAREVLPRRAHGVLRVPFDKASKGRRFLRGTMEGGAVTIPESGHASGALHALAGCNCLVDIPAGSGALKAGDTVEVLLF